MYCKLLIYLDYSQDVKLHITQLNLSSQVKLFPEVVSGDLRLLTVWSYAGDPSIFCSWLYPEIVFLTCGYSSISVGWIMNTVVAWTYN